jgi:hypothetical protein
MPVSLSKSLPPKPPAPALTPAQTAAKAISTLSKSAQTAAKAISTPSKPAQTAAKAISTPAQKPPAGSAPSNGAGDLFEAATKAASKPKVTITDTRTPLPPTRPTSVSGTIKIDTKPAFGGSAGGEASAETGSKPTRSVNQSGTIGDPNSTKRNKPVDTNKTSTSAQGTIFSVGDKAFEGLDVGNDEVGASFGVGASYKAEASVGKDGLHVEIGGQVQSGAEAHASHTEGPATIGADVFVGGRASAGVNVDVGPDGVKLGANANAFLGIEGSVHGGFHTDYGDVDAELTGQVGLGADAHADFEVTPDGHFKYDVGAGLTLGLGGKAAFSGDLDLEEIAHDAQPYIEKAEEAAKPYVEAAENVAETAGNVVEDVVETAEDVGGAVLDFFGF